MGMRQLIEVCGLIWTYQKVVDFCHMGGHEGPNFEIMGQWMGILQDPYDRGIPCQPRDHPRLPRHLIDYANNYAPI